MSTTLGGETSRNAAFWTAKEGDTKFITVWVLRELGENVSLQKLTELMSNGGTWI
jgi:hypothetical protein